jgi:hypothetical protein
MYCFGTRRMGPPRARATTGRARVAALRERRDVIYNILLSIIIY